MRNMIVNRKTILWCDIVCLCLMLVVARPSVAWGNRGHRMANLVAAETLSADMPAFLYTSDAIYEISYFGPEPDRWRPLAEPELAATSSPDHGFKLELGDLAGSYPRHRYDFIRLMATVQAPEGAGSLTPEQVGFLPWQAMEVFDRTRPGKSMFDGSGQQGIGYFAILAA